MTTKVVNLLNEGREIKTTRDVAKVSREFHSHLESAVRAGYTKFSIHLQAEEIKTDE